MRQNPVGEPAATAAWNFGTPRRRSMARATRRRFAVCDELPSLCPRNAEVINIEVAQDGPSLEVVPPMFETAA
jgi:hypothetical protein